MIVPTKLKRTSRVTWFWFFPGTSRNRLAQIDASVALPASCRSCFTGWTCLHFRHGQMVHFERPKQHHCGPTEFATTPLDTGEIAVNMDLESQLSVEPISYDLSQPSHKSEQLLSEASNVSLLSRRRYINTRLRTNLRAGGSRQHYQQFDYYKSGTGDELFESILSIPTTPQDLEPHQIPLNEPLRQQLKSWSQTSPFSTVSRRYF